MADEIDLPNLISHLAVNLDGVAGAIGDAARQGSSMGAALGGSLQETLRDAVADIPEIELDADSTDLDRDLERVRRELAELADERIGVDISIDEALRRMAELEPHLERLSNSHPNINVQAAVGGALADLEEIREAAEQVDDIDVEIDVEVDEDSPNRLAGVLAQAGAAGAQAGLSIAGGFAKAGAAIGAAIPAAAGLASTLANVAPAAGVAVTGMLAMRLASGAVKLAAVGMDEALTAALDPEKATEFNEALKKLSPEARQFAEAVKEASPALRDLQQAVQNEVFRGLAESLERTGRVVLPVLRTNLLNSAGALNDMAMGAAGAARELADNGTLGQALGSASDGLRNLSGIPGIVVAALGQVGAAAGPSFERLTAAAGKAAEGIGERLGEAFESGAMEDAIESAIDLIGQLIDIGANVGDILGSIFGAASDSGGGLLGVLESITGEIARVAATEEVQAGLGALFDVMAKLGEVAGPLLGQVLQELGPVFAELGPPVETLIESLGEALGPVIEALGPVLESAAGAFGELVEALAPVLPVLGQLIADFLPVLTPLFEALGEILEALAPSIEIIAETLGQVLAPILQALPEFLQPLLDAFVQMAEEQGPLLAELLKELQPSFVKLAEAFGQVMEELGPLLPELLMLGAHLFEKIAPYLPGLVEAFAKLAAVFTDKLVAVIEKFVIPSLELLGALMSGDTPAATAAAGRAMEGLQAIMRTVWTMIVVYVAQKISEVVAWIKGLPGRAASALSGLAGSLAVQANRAGAQLVSTIRLKIGEAIIAVGSLPGRAAAALGNLGGALVGAGASLISGFIAGIASRIPSVQSTLQGLTARLTDWKGPPGKDAKILTPAGRLLIEGFIKGIDGTTAKLRSRLESITKALPSNVRSGVGRSLRRAVNELEKLTIRRESVIKRLAAGQKKLDEVLKARSKAASDITKGILADANITTGNADVNSVSAITVGLQQALKKTQEFQANIAALRKAGLRSDLLQQIADAGVDAGGATAAALAKATPAELKKINDLQGQLAKSATSTGNTVGDALYNAGIRAAQGLVNGLKSQEKAIERQMRKIAEGMLSTVKKKHRTRSPSRAFFDIGVMDGEGLRGGLLASTRRVQDAARSMAAAALDVAAGAVGAIPAAPTAGQLATVYGGGAAGGDVTHNWHLYGSDATPQGIVRELSWLGLVGRR